MNEQQTQNLITQVRDLTRKVEDLEKRIKKIETESADEDKPSYIIPPDAEFIKFSGS